MSSRSSYIRTEVLISVLINTVLSVAFVIGVFHGQARIPVLGTHSVVRDMAPQTFMVTLMSCLVPGLVTRRRLRTGALGWHPGINGTRAVHVVVSAVLAALAMTLLVTSLCWLVLPHLLPDGVTFSVLLIAKAAFGALLASLITAWAIARVLR